MDRVYRAEVHKDNLIKMIVITPKDVESVARNMGYAVLIPEFRDAVKRNTDNESPARICWKIGHYAYNMADSIRECYKKIANKVEQIAWEKGEEIKSNL